MPEQNRFYTQTLIEGTKEESLHAVVDAKKWMNFALAHNPIGTALRSIDPAIINRQGSDRFEDWLLASHKNAGEFQHLVFARDYSKINPDTNLPYSATPVKTDRPSGDGYIPGILVGKPRIVLDYNFPISTNWSDGTDHGIVLTPTPRVFYDYIPAATEGFQYIVETFLSNTEIIPPKIKAPVARQIQIPVQGQVITIKECLHEELHIEQQSTSSSVILSSGTVKALGGSIPGQKIPATNFTTWKVYLKKAEPFEIDGIRGMVLTTCIPPNLPEPIVIQV